MHTKSDLIMLSIVSVAITGMTAYIGIRFNQPTHVTVIAVLVVGLALFVELYDDISKYFKHTKYQRYK